MDKKAKEILFKTHWSSSGWLMDRKTPVDDFEYAKFKGLMFDPLSISKAELLDRLDRVVNTISLKKITDAFICSLSNKRLDWRSGLGSYANAKRLLTRKNIEDNYYGYGDNQDLNVLNFERIKWGGVRHGNGLYNLLDLELLNKEDIAEPTNADKEILQNILRVIDISLVDDTPVKLRDNLKQIIKAPKAEIDILIEILGCAGIIEPLRYDRKLPSKYDWTFALYWRGEDKYNKEKVKLYFGRYDIE